MFNVAFISDPHGRARRRAVGRTGPDPVKTTRGHPRVGSEGWFAFLISQAVEASPKIYMNNPGPDRIRARTYPPSAIAIVTDFIGSGQRVRAMLDKFWAVETVRSWVSRGWISFKVIAAVGTKVGLDRVGGHRLKPHVRAEYIAPTLHTSGDRAARLSLIRRYGPTAGRGAGRTGYGDTAALVAFSYRIPNNTPALFHQDAAGWRGLYTGPAPQDLSAAFGMITPEEQVERSASANGITLSPDLATADAKTIIVLSSIRGRWRPKSETALAEATGFTETELMAIRRRAVEAGLLDQNGRLTDPGQLALAAGTARERKRPNIPSRTSPYYPQALGIPGKPSSTSRRSRRPR